MFKNLFSAVLVSLLWIPQVGETKTLGSQSSNTTTLVGISVGDLASGNVVPGIAGVNYGVPSATELAYYHSKNLNTIRLPFLWERMQPTLNGTLDPTYLGIVQTILANAASNSQQVILDCHNFGHYNTPETQSIGIGDGSTLTFSTTLNAIPTGSSSVMSVSYTIGGTPYTATDTNSTGTITGTDLTGTVNYTTGLISLTFSVAPDSTTVITGNWHTYLPIGSTYGPTYSQFANLWSRLATAVGGTSGLLGYDLQNEPHDMPSASVVPSMYQAAVTAIRGAGDVTSTIYLEGDAYASAYGWNGTCGNCGGAPIGGWAQGGNYDLLAITDPNNKIVYQAHAYGDYNGSGTYPIYPNSAAIGCTNGQTSYQCANTMGDQLTTPTSTLDTGIIVKRYTPFINWCNVYHVNCMIGETGVPQDDPNWLTALDNGLAVLKTNNILLTYWVAGPFEAGYPLTVEQQTSGRDTVQMAVLTKYDGAYPSNTYYISGPSRGTSGVASSNFTVSYYGYLTNSVTITPNDGGAGGTFTPSSLTFSSGFNANGTFTYTAPGTDVYAISATNSAGWINPTSTGYATISDIFVNATYQPTNVFAFHKIYAPYIGPALTLRRSIDNTTKTFNFSSIHYNALLDMASIIGWNGTSQINTLSTTSVIVKYAPMFSADAGVKYVPSGTYLTQVASSPSVGQYSVTAGGSYTFNAADIGNTVKISYIFPTYLVNQYDQSPNGNNSGPPASSPTNADQPQFLANCINNVPCTNWNSSRMDANSPINGNAGQTIVMVQSNTGTITNLCDTYSNPQFQLSWGVIQYYRFGSSTPCSNGNGNGGSQWLLGSDNAPTIMFDSNGAWHTYFATYTPNQQQGIIVYKDGLANNAYDSTQSSILVQFTNTVNLGYFRFGTSYFFGQLGDIIIYPGALTNSDLTAIQSNLQSFWNTTPYAANTIPTPPSPSPSTPTSLPEVGINLSMYPSVATSTQSPTYTGTEATYYYSRSMKMARMQFFWEELQSTPGAALNATNIANLQAQVVAVQAQGMDVMIDMHNFCQYNMLESPITLATGNGSTTTFNYTVPTTINAPPNYPFTITYTIGSVLYTANGNNAGVITGTNISSGSINYSTGVLSLTFSTAPDNATPITLATWYSYQPIGTTYGPSIAQFTDFWHRMGQALPNSTYPKINFDLQNEPLNCRRPTWEAAAQSVVNQLRTDGWTNYIFVEGAATYSAASDFVQYAETKTDAVANGTTTITSASFGFNQFQVGEQVFLSGGTNSLTGAWYTITGFTNSSTITVNTTVPSGTGISISLGAWGYYATLMTDSSNKLIFSPHNYFNASGSDLGNMCASGGGNTQLVAATTWARSNSLKLFLGEFAIPNTNSCYTEVNNALQYMHTNNDVWYGWTYWGGGSYWGETYYPKIEPGSFKTPYVDRPNMIILVNNHVI